MLVRRLAVSVGSFMLVAFASPETTWAAAYPLAPAGGSGLQYHIGGGLALPIQAKVPRTPNPTPGCTVAGVPQTTGNGVPTAPCPTGVRPFPPLLVPPLGGAATPTGFVLQTSGPDPKAITIHYPIIGKPAGVLKKVGVFKDNPGIFQVATNLSVQLPQNSGAGMFELATVADGTMVGRTGATTTTFTTPFAPGNKITYSNALAQRFGGPARFFVGNPGTKPAGALFTGANATVWVRAGGAPGVPPCVHPAFGGLNAACVAIMINAAPNPIFSAAAWGAPVGVAVSTPGGTPMALVTVPGATMTAKPKKGPEPGIMVVSAPTTMGLVAMSAFTAMAPTAMTGLTNMAASTGYPWTTGMITMKAPAAPGGGEVFTITGMDTRVGGVGAIQLVSGTLSRRTVTGPNANRAWLRLALPEPSATLGAVGALGMLALCHALARRRSR